MPLTAADLTAFAPDDRVIAGTLDTSEANQAQILQAVLTSAEEEIMARIGQRYALPLPTPVPAQVTALIKLAATLCAIDLLYTRRGYMEDQNPWAKRASEVRKKFDRIGTGAERLYPTGLGPGEEGVSIPTAEVEVYMTEASMTRKGNRYKPQSSSGVPVSQPAPTVPATQGFEIIDGHVVVRNAQGDIIGSLPLVVAPLPAAP